MSESGSPVDLADDSLAAMGLRRYARLVAVAVGAPEDGVSVDLDPPVSAYIAMPQRIPGLPEWDFALTWDEINGWAAAIETSAMRSVGDDLIVVAYLGGDVLPPPRLVALLTSGLVRGEQLGQFDPPEFRTVDADDDLPGRLAWFAPPPPAG